MTRAEYLRLGSHFGYGAKETMMLRPGVLFDMLELQKKARKDEG